MGHKIVGLLNQLEYQEVQVYTLSQIIRSYFLNKIVNMEE